MKSYLLPAALLGLMVVAAPAYAALGDQSMDPAANNGSDQSADDSAPKVQAPPSPTPGSKTAAPVVAATGDVRSLSPNDALFDAITRGDTDAARDAIARGADLNAVNALGQKPVDAAVDLGRNDITIVLLAQRPLVANVPAEAAAPAPVATKVRDVAPVKPNPGTPQPQVGFLGF